MLYHVEVGAGKEKMSSGFGRIEEIKIKHNLIVQAQSYEESENKALDFLLKEGILSEDTREKILENTNEVIHDDGSKSKILNQNYFDNYNISSREMPNEVNIVCPI